MVSGLIVIVMLFALREVSGLYMRRAAGMRWCKTFATLTKTIPVPSHAMPTVTVRSDAKLFREGNPLVYSGSITSTIGVGAVGQEVRVKDSAGNVFGRGFFNPHSQYRVRLLITREHRLFDSPMPDIIADHIRRAALLRRSLLLPSSRTDVYRLVNGEGDQLSGLMIDILGSTVVIQSSASWVELNRGVIEAAVRDLPSLKDKEIVWKRSESRLKQDGWDQVESGTVDVIASKLETASATEASAGDTTVVENGVRYTLCVDKDQKTGFYCDQRDNRQLIRSLAADKSVLDLYSYTGGITLNALLGGAKSVTAVDSSVRALETLRKNIALNGINCDVNIDGMGPNATVAAPVFSSGGEVGIGNKVPQQVALIKGDAEKVMSDLLAAGKSYDLVICDPPKLAPRRVDLKAAARKYQHVNAKALQLVNPAGGLLLTCSCSAAMTQEAGLLERTVQAAAMSVGRTVTVVGVTGAAGDHPVLPAYPEGRYLTAILMHVTANSP